MEIMARFMKYDTIKHFVTFIQKCLDLMFFYYAVSRYHSNLLSSNISKVWLKDKQTATVLLKTDVRMC